MKKSEFLWQAIKHFLIGAFATIIDLGIFEFMFWLFYVFLPPAIIKATSFSVAIIIKYLGNKFWTFRKIENGVTKKEFTFFVVINLIGLAIDVSVFVFLTQILGPQFSASIPIWRKLSVIFAAVIAGVWNFLGDKFLVFKK